MPDFLFSRQFFPLFWVQFLGALNDNVFKNAMVMWITFRLAETGAEAGLLITAAAGVFILPFFLFSALAGQIADHYPKSGLIRKIKLAEVLIMLTGGVAFVTGSIDLLFVVLFLMGSQSAFFGPIKYAILPEVLTKTELVKGNAWFSGSTFVAILLGTLIGGYFILHPNGASWIAAGILGLALVGYGLSLKVPQTEQGDESLQIESNFVRSTWREVTQAKTFSQAWIAVLSISWFWFLGAVYLSQMPIYAHTILHGDEKLVLVYLTVFSISIGLGAFWASHHFANRAVLNKLSQLAQQPLWLVGIALLILVSNLTIRWLPDSHWMTYWIGLSLAGIAMLGGRYIVPFYTLLQTTTPPHFLARMVAVNNILNALVMVVSSLLLMLGYAFGLDLISILYLVAGLNFLMALWLAMQMKKRKA